MTKSLTVLGIDPGTRRVGYGIITKTGSTFDFITAGLLKVGGVEDSSALLEIKTGMEALIAKYAPEVIGIEKLFFVKNQKTGIAVAQARGVILLSAREHDARIVELAPNEVKSGIAGYGLADKSAVAKMVRVTLGKPELRVIDDVSDALAIAIVASGRVRI